MNSLTRWSRAHDHGDVTGPAEGKSTTIANLAVALAWGNRRVALVDLDLRRPYRPAVPHLSGRPGITERLALKRADGLLRRFYGLSPLTTADPGTGKPHG